MFLMDEGMSKLMIMVILHSPAKEMERMATLHKCWKIQLRSWILTQNTLFPPISKMVAVHQIMQVWLRNHVHHSSRLSHLIYKIKMSL